MLYGRWVDEQHALAVFSEPEAAQQALRRSGKYKLVPFAKVTFLLVDPTGVKRPAHPLATE